MRIRRAMRAVCVLGAAGLLGCAALPCWGAAERRRDPGPATVAVVHSDSFVLPKTFLTPSSVYPLGKLDYRMIANMLDAASMLATGTSSVDDAWGTLLLPTDRVGVLLDAQTPPATLALVDAVIDRMVQVGVRPRNITIWAEDERALFTAGLLVRKDPEGINTMGADSEGFRGGTSRILLGYCDVLVNVARLRPDRKIGLWGAVANHLACVPRAERIRLLSNPNELATAATRPAARVKFKLHILDALQPHYEPGAMTRPPHWDCGKLVLGTDPVAVDIVGQQILEEKRAAVKGEPWPLRPAPEYLAAACHTYSLGQCDPDQITTLTRKVGERRE